MLNKIISTWIFIYVLFLHQLNTGNGLSISGISVAKSIRADNRLQKPKLTKYAVSLRLIENSQHFGDTHFCAGVIISSDTILTAAHCLINGSHGIIPPRDLSVVAGSSNRLRIDNTTEIMKVATITAHPKFWPKRDQDIAVLKLINAFPNDNNAIKGIQMARYDPAPGTKCISFGWGRLFYNGPIAAEAVYFNLTIIDHGLCRTIFKRRLGASMLCAMPENGTKGVCHGDSGGPLICDGKLMGITSWGAKQCGVLPIPTVFTNVFKLRKWIEEARKRPKTCSEKSTMPISNFMLSLSMLLLLMKIRICRVMNL